MTDHRTGPTTERLLLRALTPADAEAFFALNGDERVMRWTGEPLLSSIDAARDAIARYPDFDSPGYGRWGCVLRESGEMIGFCGLKHLPELDAVDLGFRFRPAYWGRGLATEAGLASLAYGFDVLGLDEIIALVLPENAASIRVLERLGMRFDGELHTDGLRALRYVKTADPDSRSRPD